MMQKAVKKWFEIADRDFKSAKALAEKELFETALFHCQQAAEKYLKGFLVNAKKQFPKVHDLVYLVKESEKEDKGFKEIESDAFNLTDFAVMYRYPLDKKIRFTAGDCKRAIGGAQRIRDFILKKVEK